MRSLLTLTQQIIQSGATALTTQPTQPTPPPPLPTLSSADLPHHLPSRYSRINSWVQKDGKVTPDRVGKENSPSSELVRQSDGISYVILSFRRKHGLVVQWIAQWTSKVSGGKQSKRIAPICLCLGPKFPDFFHLALCRLKKVTLILASSYTTKSRNTGQVRSK